MNGMDILLQSIGLDPDTIKQTIGAVQQQFQMVNARLERMERKLDAAIAAQRQGVSSGNSHSDSGAGAGGIVTGSRIE